MTARRVGPTWRPAPMQRELVTVAAVGMLAALVFGRPALVVLAAPLLGALLAGHLRPAPRALDLEWWCEPTRVLEGDRVTVELTVDPPVGRLSGTLPWRAMPGQVDLTAGARAARWTLTPGRWGRWPAGPLRAGVVAPSGLVFAEVELELPALTVFPATPALALPPAAERMAREIGEHVAARTGHGGELAMVRPLRPGDPARQINWAVSRRRRELHVNQRWAEHAQDVVVAVDTFDDVGPPGRRSLDVAVRGAAATVAGYLRHHDRVGLVVLDGMLRWLGADGSDRQFYRIMEYLLDLPGFESVVTPRLDRLPRQALPPGALVVVFSPLLDDRAVDVVFDLARRGHPTVVVDVLTAEPPAADDEASRLALRLWRLDRLALRRELAEMGVAVLRWDGTDSLDAALGPPRRRRLSGRPPSPRQLTGVWR